MNINFIMNKLYLCFLMSTAADMEGGGGTPDWSYDVGHGYAHDSPAIDISVMVDNFYST